MKLVSLFIIAFIFLNAHTQSNLRLEEIMKGNVFVGNQPSNPIWSWDGKRIYFDWNPENNPGNSTYYWEKGMNNAKKLPIEEFADTYLDDHKQQGKAFRYYLRSGALFRFNTATKKHEKIYHSAKAVSKFSLVSSNIYFEQEGNLFSLQTNSGFIQQVTNFKNGNKPEIEEKSNNFLEEQQKELFNYIKEQEHNKKWNKLQQDQKRLPFPKAYYYGKWDLENLQISPDEKFVLFRLSNYPEGHETQIEKYVSADGFSTEDKARGKVSLHAQSSHKMGIYDLKSDSVYFIDFSHLSDLNKQAAYLSLYAKGSIEIADQRKIVMNEAIFNDKGTHTILVIRSIDNKDRWIVRLDLKSGVIEELDHQHDAAWIGGPGIGDYPFENGNLGFLKDQESFYFQTEESGYSHLYSMQISTKKKTQLSAGNWEVREASLSHDKNYFYITANKTHPGNRDFYRLNLQNGVLENILTTDGFHEVHLSPDESKLLIRYSYKNIPWELYLADNKPNTSKTRLTHSTTAAFEAYKWREPEVIQIEAKDKTKVYARLYRASETNKNKAAIIFVHGAGYLQNAHNYWSHYLREYMFHNLLADEGYTVLDIDYRASDGYGRDFRTGIYRFMGGLDLSDQLDGRKLLINQYGIDSNRIGIYGGSYGGFITLMALFNHPGAFKCGAALRSVTDWAHYNQEYTSNILNYPETDPEAYRKSSPIYFAENLQDELLMLHGVVDDNVQFQDVVRLSQRLIELDKKNWELALFPVEAHAFKETSSWLNEYRRIYELFEKNLKH